MSREKLIEMALNNKKHSDAGTMEYVDNILEIPAANYYDADIWQKEVDLIFKRTPLVLGVSKEMPNPGDYKSIDVLGVPVLITRDSDGNLNAYLNACLLYTSDAADDSLRVDLGGRRIIKKYT